MSKLALNETGTYTKTQPALKVTGKNGQAAFH